MSVLRTSLFAMAAVLAFTSAFAQDRPDFSGRWTSDPDTTAAAPAGRGQAANTPAAGASRGGGGGLGSGWGSNITIAQTDSRLTVEYAFFTRNDMQPPLKFVYALDGSETSNSVMMGRGTQTQTSTMSWQGDTLRITTTHHFDDPASNQPQKIEVTQSLALESPTSLIVETSRGGALGGPPSTTKTVYRKR